jgi:hypothetical protein
LMSCVVGFLLMLDVVRLTDHLSFVRYTLAMSAAVAVSVPLMCQAIWPRLAAPAAASVCLLGAIHFQNPVLTDPSDFAEVRRVLEKRVGPGEPVFFYPKFATSWEAEGAMLASSHSRTLFPRDVALLSVPGNERLYRHAAARTAWLVVWTPASTSGDVLPGARLLEETWAERYFWIGRFELPGPPSAESPRAGDAPEGGKLTTTGEATSAVEPPTTGEAISPVEPPMTGQRPRAGESSVSGGSR